MVVHIIYLQTKSGSISKLLAYIVEHTILEYGYVALEEA